MWTHFWDMHSGGGLKEPWQHIYIEAPMEQAKSVFYNRFGHNPDRVTCTCCGNDYSISEEETLADVTWYQRNCDTGWFYVDSDEEVTDMTDERFPQPRGVVWDTDAQQHVVDGRVVECRHVERPSKRALKTERYQTLDEYLQQDILVIYDSEISDYEKSVKVPEQGYIWV